MLTLLPISNHVADALMATIVPAVTLLNLLVLSTFLFPLLVSWRRLTKSAVLHSLVCSEAPSPVPTVNVKPLRVNADGPFETASVRSLSLSTCKIISTIAAKICFSYL